jgi:hypothetical protein
MKSSLILKKFETDGVPGTMNVKELRTFFGSKMLSMENNIIINNDAISFSYVDGGKNTGFQYFDKENIPDDWEQEYVENLTDLKLSNTSLTLLNQSLADLNNNTKWRLEIKANNILRDYLFYKIRESRVFQGIKYSNFYNKGINESVYNYIDLNLKDRYKFDGIDLYVKYFDIPKQSSTRTGILLQFQPNFTENVYLPENKIANFSFISLDEYKFEKIIIHYYQTKPSITYKFDYYFDLKFVKV